MRPYTRSLHPEDYRFLREYVAALEAFQRDMVIRRVPHRDWHPHRMWEYGSISQQLRELKVPSTAEIIDVGAGGSFFDPFLACEYPLLCCTDSMKYGDVSADVQAQRLVYGVALPLYDLSLEDMSANLDIGWGGATNKFDVTMCISTIEHVQADRHDDALRELWRITKPGGLIFITSDYFRDLTQFEASPSRHLQFTPYMKESVLNIPSLIDVEFVVNHDPCCNLVRPRGEGDHPFECNCGAVTTDLDYRGDFVHSYSFCNICLRKRSPASTGEAASTGGQRSLDNGKG